MASVTIGVPVYNGAATLRECLECLRNQTFRDIEILKAGIENDPAARLAAPNVVFLRKDSSVKAEHAYPDVSGASRATRIGRTLMGMNPSWIYGLWDRRTLIATLERTSAAYPYLWAWDPLALFPVILDEGVSNAEHTRLYKRVVPARYSSRTTAANMMAMRWSFRAACLEEFGRRNWTLWERMVLLVYVFRFTNKNVYRPLKLMRRYIREKLGIVK